MDLASFTVPASRLSRMEDSWGGPLAVIDLESAQADLDLRLPPCPVIGLGNRAHPLASKVDVVMEPPFEVATLIRNVAANPRAAGAFVQLLRSTAGLEPACALPIESMAYAMLQGSAEHAAWKSARRSISATPGRVRAERRDNLLEIVLDRAASGNAIDRQMRDDLSAVLGLASLDASLHQICLKGAGKAFSLGADLDEFGTTADPATAHAIRSLTLPAYAAAECAERLEVHVDGACVGAGIELAAFAHRIYATQRSWFQLPELAMGIIPGAGGCVSLPRRIGRQRTTLMFLSGRRLSARLALDWGLVDALVDDFASHERGCNVI
ncbi:enoyl-CoA hydratase/isomerase family protein [Novosphingobium sp. RD2P27]|uniref:Enoyl-CoA hydratase/isomerase family protein n=1 Tax=Novosphingobium kalidii TaxID=3230299 RepID=A0ABV2D4E9_9SPHN